MPLHPDWLKYWRNGAWVPASISYDVLGSRGESYPDFTWNYDTGSGSGGGTTTPTLTATSISLAGGGTQNGGTRTLTATVSPSGATGSVQFRKGSTTGSIVATKSVSSGKASVSVGEGTYYARYLGSGSYEASPWSNSQSVTIRVLKTKTTTKNSNYIARYDGSGSKSNYYTSGWRQGYYSSTHGNWRSLIGFSRLNVSNLSSVVKVELILDISHTFYGSGMSLDIGWHDKGSPGPSSFGTGKGAVNKSGASRTVGNNRTIDITSWAKSVVTKSAFRGIALGSGGSANRTHYGYGTGPQLRITYKQWV